MAADREYDLIIWGSTGFTGMLVAERAQQYVSGGSAGASTLKWAIGGRSRSKLEKVKAGLPGVKNDSKYPGVVIADLQDQQSVSQMAKSTLVLVTTAGPYALVGEPIVRACVENGTHYADITGETPFIAEMIEKYQSQAEQTGSRLVPFSGFDSVPADIGQLFAACELKARQPNAEVISDLALVSFISKHRGNAASSGTMSSIINLLENPTKHTKRMYERYFLSPDSHKQPPTGAHTKLDREVFFPKYSQDAHAWYTVFVMAICNTRVARRGVALYHQQSKQSPFANNYCYNEGMKFSSVFLAWVVTIGIALGSGLLLLPPVRWALKKYLIKAGTGPSKQVRENSTGVYEHIATASDGSKLHALFSVTDPGYGNTAQQIFQVALLLTEDAKRNNGSTDSSSDVRVRGLPAAKGFLTASSAFGYRLIERLQKCDGYRIEVVKHVPNK